MNKKVLLGCGGLVAVLLIVAVIVFSTGIGFYNTMVTMEQDVVSGWSQVENVYQRRLDLIPNLVETVKGYASHESSTLQAVVEARAKAGGMVNISKEALENPETLQKFNEVQGSLGSALQRLMVVQEQYPDLKANQNFLDLQSQLEGTENRIAVERRNYNEIAKSYNTYIKSFPKNILAGSFGFKEKAYFEAQSGAENAPKVKF